MRRSLALVSMLVLVGGCHRKASDERTCGQAGAQFYQLALARVTAAKTAGADRDRMVNVLAPMRDAMVRACQDDGWAAPARACFAGALDLPALEACDSKLTPAQVAKLSAAAAR